ncbi:hypothetical protein AgCh_014767 [Apium graveolens]
MSAIHFKFYATNNDAEYEALINDLKLAMEVGAVNLIVRSDSELVVNERFANYSNAPTSTITSLASLWPFAMWGIDLIGELPKAKGGVKYAVVAVDYFTKWVEAMPLATITAKEDKGFCAQFHSMQSNGQTEAINKIIKHTLKAKLEEKKGDWPEEMPMVLWSYNTTPRSTTGETPFLLTYGYEAMVPVEQSVARYFNKRVKSVPFKVGDLVLRKVMPNTKIAQHGVLGANWEGPYKVKAILWKGTYRLEDLDGKLIPRAWNAEHLRKYYQ